MIIQDILYQPICPLCQTKAILNDGISKYSSCPFNHWDANLNHNYVQMKNNIISFHQNYSSRLFPKSHYLFQNNYVKRTGFDLKDHFIDNYIDPNITKQLFLKSNNLPQLINKLETLAILS